MRWLLSFLLLLIAVPASAQPVQTQEQALADDAIQYAAQFGVTPNEGLRRLAAQQASVAATDAIRAEFADRLAGISIEHSPGYRVIVLLTGDNAVADRIVAGVPIVFRTAAKATREQAVAAMRKHLIDFRADLPNARGAGYDQRTGEVVLLVTPADADKYGTEAIKARAEQIGGVPVRVVVNELRETNLSVEGGGRVEGASSVTGRRSSDRTSSAMDFLARWRGCLDQREAVVGSSAFRDILQRA